jgi:gas vesicle protein
MRFAWAVAGASLAAGAAGCALGMLMAPASGAELRRRLTWKARDQYKSMGRAWELMVDRAAEKAKQELKRRASCANSSSS